MFYSEYACIYSVFCLRSFVRYHLSSVLVALLQVLGFDTLLQLLATYSIIVRIFCDLLEINDLFTLMEINDLFTFDIYNVFSLSPNWVCRMVAIKVIIFGRSFTLAGWTVLRFTSVDVPSLFSW